MRPYLALADPRPLRIALVAWSDTGTWQGRHARGTHDLAPAGDSGDGGPAFYDDRP